MARTQRLGRAATLCRRSAGGCESPRQSAGARHPLTGDRSGGMQFFDFLMMLESIIIGLG